jgi:CHRD domain
MRAEPGPPAARWFSLTAPSGGNPGSSSGCVTLTDTTLFAKIRNSPSDFYVNVHTATFPNGEIRGQLF